MPSNKSPLSRSHVPILLAMLVAFTPQGSAPALSVTFDCDGARGISENETSNLFTCWGHWGTHTYVVHETHGVFLASGYGEFESVENWHGDLEGGVVIETSLDGREWSTISIVPFPSVTCNLTWKGCPTKFSFALGPSLEEFRFLRLREPKSMLGGLAGYLDDSWLVLNLTMGNVLPAGASTQGTVHLGCEDDIMERIFDEHPCTYGGYYYDSPSFYHTYYLGGVANLTSVDVTAAFEPFRFPSIGTTRAVLEYRVGGTSKWSTLATWTTPFGVDSNASWSDPHGREAEYLRIRTKAYCVGWPPNCSYAQHHWSGYLTQSSLGLTGALPSEG